MEARGSLQLAFACSVYESAPVCTDLKSCEIMRAQVLHNVCHNLRFGCQRAGAVHATEWRPTAVSINHVTKIAALQRAPSRHSTNMAAAGPPKGKRVGQVIRLRPEKYEE